MVAPSRFHAEEPKMLGASVQNVVARGFVQPSSKLSKRNIRFYGLVSKRTHLRNEIAVLTYVLRRKASLYQCPDNAHGGQTYQCRKCMHLHNQLQTTLGFTTVAVG